MRVNGAVALGISRAETLTLEYVSGSPGGLPRPRYPGQIPRVSNSVVPQRSLRICTSNKTLLMPTLGTTMFSGRMTRSAKAWRVVGGFEKQQRSESGLT